MNIFRWFDSREATRFAKSIALEIRDLSPPETQRTDTRSPSIKEMKKMEKIFYRIYKFSEEQRLNIYTKAKFLNTLRWELADGGYPLSYIDHLIGIIAPKL